MGVPLFERTRQGMRPTQAGTIMVDRARRAVGERERAEIQPAPGEVTGIITVGLLESAGDLLAEPLVSAVTRDHPGVELRLLTAYSGHLQQRLDEGDLDLALFYNLDSTPSLNALPLVRERLWAVAPPAAGLRADRPVPVAEDVALLAARVPGHPDTPVPRRPARVFRGVPGRGRETGPGLPQVTREWKSAIRSHIATGLEYMGQCPLHGISATSTPPEVNSPT